ncbi:MAG: cation-translocating P-type ATPase [Nevskiaceae bacterium]|nr:MAG: cation-translocating P-type ATPase [Nevskiaceae bacterium]TAM26688.1 MAG: cation-translocating P-type ATPase [Nevskiaceae bacterium]
MDAEQNGGLSSAEAAERLARLGPNEQVRDRPRGWTWVAYEMLREPMFLLLSACGAVYLMLGEPGETALLLVALALIIGITFVQKQRTQRALEALRELSSPRALVIRDGQRRRIAGREVVPGDLLVLSEGDRVAADALLIDARNLRVDESLLTGEALAVLKRADPAALPSAPGGEGSASVFSGSLVVSGTGVARVVATGAKTALGGIGQALRGIEEQPTRLQQETNGVVRRLAPLALLLSLLVALVLGYTRGTWLQGLLAGLALAMSLLPEEFPVVLTVFLALGAWRMSRRQVLTRRTAAIEALGAATVLCVDKTGTLTENRMTVRTLVPAGGERLVVGSEPLPEAAHALVEFAILATRRDPFDPMERAIHALGLGGLVEAEHLHADWQLAREYPLAPALPAMSQVWEARRGGERTVAAKGAPEAIVELCHLDAAQAEAVYAQARTLAASGLRVLAVARARLTHGEQDVSLAATPLPPSLHDFAFEFLGLLGLSDPLRAGVPASVAAFREAGIRVLMVTGDYAETASHIAAEAGLAEPQRVLGGAEIETLDEAGLAAALARCSVIARARPEHKLRIVRALQQAGEVVAMTGDGVNDAPALRAADIGIAMGGRGTDVAREAAHLVLADDDFSSIVHAVRLGRRIFDNLRRAVAYIIAVHIPIAGLSLLPILLGWPLLLLPAHIAFLQLIIDPACSLAFEAEPGDPAAMRRPPRRRDTRLFDVRTLWTSLLRGSLVLLLVWLTVLAVRAQGGSTELVRGAGFIVLVLGNLALLGGNRAAVGGLRARLRQPNWLLAGISLGALLALAVVLYVPAARRLFRFEAPSLTVLLACLAGAALIPLLLAVAGRWRRPDAGQ